MKSALVLVLILLLLASGALTFFTRQKKGGGDIRYAEIQHGPKTMVDVTFSHDFHTSLPQLKCVTCHTSLFTMNRENFAKIKQDGDRVHAHFDRDQFCGHCHNNATAFNTDNCNLGHEKAQAP